MLHTQRLNQNTQLFAPPIARHQQPQYRKSLEINSSRKTCGCITCRKIPEMPAAIPTTRFELNGRNHAQQDEGRCTRDGERVCSSRVSVIITGNIYVADVLAGRFLGMKKGQGNKKTEAGGRGTEKARKYASDTIDASHFGSPSWKMANENSSREGGRRVE